VEIRVGQGAGTNGIGALTFEYVFPRSRVPVDWRNELWYPTEMTSCKVFETLMRVADGHESKDVRVPRGNEFWQ
jgi:hypothetical protein